MTVSEPACSYVVVVYFQGSYPLFGCTGLVISHLPVPAMVPQPELRVFGAEMATGTMTGITLT